MPALVSVIIPTHNRPLQLRACLAALAGSSYPADRFEVVVVDDGGSARLGGIIDALPTGPRVTLIQQEQAGPAAARNRGAAAAHGELLVFTDDDCLPEPGWLATLVRHAEARPGHLIGGVTLNALDGNPFSAASQHLVSYLYDYSTAQAGNPEWSGFFTSNNLAVPIEGFERIGGFDAAFPLAAGEDRDFCDRWAHAGLPMAFAPDARILHAHRLALRSFCRQHWNYGRGAYHFHQSRSRRGADPVRPQPPSFYLDLVRYPFKAGRTGTEAGRAGTEVGPRAGAEVGSAGTKGRRGQAVLEAALLAASQGVNALGYFYEKLVRRT